MAAKYSSAEAISASIATWASAGCGTREGQNSIEVLTTRTNLIDPPEACARRAATGMARSAPGEPSRGTRIRFNMVLFSFQHYYAPRHNSEGLRCLFFI